MRRNAFSPSDKMPVMEEEAIEYHPTPPTFPVTPPPPEDSGESSSDEYPLDPPDLVSPPPECSDENEEELPSPPTLLRSAGKSPHPIMDKDSSIIEIIETIENDENQPRRVMISASAAPPETSPTEDIWKKAVMDIIGMKQSGNKRKNENILKEILNELRRKHDHENDGECEKCELTAEDMMLEIEQPSEGESTAEITSKLIKNIKKAKKAIKHTHTKRVSSFTQTDAANDAEAAGRAPIISPQPNVDCNAANLQPGKCQRRKILGVPDRKLGYSTQLVRQLTEELGTIKMRSKGITNKCESYYEAAVRLGVDGLHAYRKKIEKEFIAELEEKCSLGLTEEYIDEVYKEAKERQRRIQRISMDISMPMHNLHDHDMWKRWGTYQHIDRAVARANKQINEWKDAAWQKIHFIDEDDKATTPK